MSECILVSVPHVAIRAALARTLMPLGYIVEIASSERTARQLTSKKRFAAAIVAARSGSTDDFALIHRLRNAADKLVLLVDDAGAADRLTSSFPEALVCSSQRLENAKLCGFLGNPAQKASDPAVAGQSELLRFADRTLDVAGRIFLDANGREVALTRGEFALLVTFARNAGRVLSRAHLRNAVDGGRVDAYERSIDMLVARLRRKIEPEPAKPQFVITVPGVGYKFVACVHGGNPAASELPGKPGQVCDIREAPSVERRQVTVLSCQILGFAELAAKLDPEDLQRAISPVYAACADVVPRYGGTTLHTFGDSILAYFGHPKAHENDAPRAVEAALELLRVIRAIEAVPIGNFRARIGIATGLVVVSELPDGGALRQPTAIGAAQNLAFHMQKAAPVESVVIAETTRNLIGRFFLCREIEPVELEGGREPVPAWRVVEEIAGIPRFEALRRDAMLDFVGREAEIERLRQCWSKALLGSGQVVLLSGEAGIGKSRLVVETESRLCRKPYVTLRFYGSPHRADASMWVLIDELQRSAGFSDDDAVPQRIEKLQREFSELGPAAAEATALSCTLLGLPYETLPNVRQLSPQRRKERTFAALMARIEAMASRQAVFAIVEDVHWADPTSLEFVSLLVERASTMRIFLTIVARPEFVPSWPEHSHVTTLSLSRLSHADSAALIQQLAGERHISGSMHAAIIARADGVPLFVEELTKSILENSANGDTKDLRIPAAGCAPIPTTLHGLLISRLDRLDRGKEVAQAGAVIGREFSFELLRSVAGLDETVLRAALNQLVASGLAFRHGSLPDATFVFKHALVRDAAYNMLVRERRQALHRDVARAHEESLPETAQAQPELLAYHWREAGDPIKAIGYLLIAAERALQRSATSEALSQLAQARELISELAAGDRPQFELKLEITMARALLAARGYTAPETREAYRRARAQCEMLSNEAQLPLIIHGQWLVAWMAADHHAALERARELYLWGERNHDQVGLAMGHSDMGMTLVTLGRLVEARNDFKQALQINRFALPGRQPFVASDVDGRISALSFMQNCLLLLGFPDEAKAAAEEAASLDPQNLYSRALAAVRTLRMGIFARDPAAVAENGRAIVRLSQEQGYPHMVATAMVYTGWAQAQLGDVEAGLDVCRRGLAQLQSIGSVCWWPFLLALLAECHQQAGDLDRAATCVAQCLESVEATEERLWESEIYRLKGRLLEHGGDADAATACFAAALNKSRARGVKLLELRAARSLADLLARGGRPAEAHAVLAPIYASFSEGFDFIDLREAKALLDSLSIDEPAAHH